MIPTEAPTVTPTVAPTATSEPTATPTEAPEPTETPQPTEIVEPTEVPELNGTPAAAPTAPATLEPTATVVLGPTAPPAADERGNSGINPTDGITPIAIDDTAQTATVSAEIDQPATEAGSATETPAATEVIQATDATEVPAARTPPAAIATETPAEVILNTPTGAATGEATASRPGINTIDGVTPIPADDTPEPTAVSTVASTVEPSVEPPVSPTETRPAADRPQVIVPVGSDDSGTANGGNGGQGDNSGPGNGRTSTDGSDSTTSGRFSIDAASVTTYLALGAAPPGPLRISPDGSLFITSNGGETIGVASFGGGEQVLGDAYYPIWTGQGQILVTYYPDSSGSPVIGLLSPDGSVSPVTQTDPGDPGRRDVPAGETGGALYYQRNWPNEPARGIEIHRVDGGNDQVIWSDRGLVPVGKHPSQTPNGSFLIATNDGWYRIDGSGGASPLGGTVNGEPVAIAFGPGDQVAVLGGSQLTVGSVGNPGGGAVVGGVGDGAGVTWSPDGSRLAVASGNVLSIYDSSGNLLRTFTSDAGSPLSGLSWTRNELLVVRGGGNPGLISIPADQLP